jgi:alpha-beta hydrolase superfamily lysophospholipase
LAEPGAFTVETFTASDGYRWRYRRYADAGQPSSALAHVVCIHGIQSHGGWYVSSCTRLRAAGFAVYFLDRRGAGLNEQDRGDTPSFRRLLDDAAEFLDHLRSTTPATQQPMPIFLVAISWGGKVATALLRRRPGCAEGVALLCPGFFPRVSLSLRERLRIAWARLVAPRRQFPVPLDDPELFTASPQWHQFLRDDPLTLHRATARFLVESVRLDIALRRAPGSINVPVLLLLAEKDRIIDNAPTRRFVERFATTDQEVIEYGGAHHTLEFEPDPGQFISDLQRWLTRQVGL